MKFPTAARRAATIAARATTNNNAAKQSKAPEGCSLPGRFVFCAGADFFGAIAGTLPKKAYRLASDKYRFSKNAQ